MSAKDTLYLKIDQNIVVTDRRVTIGDVAKMECTDQAALRQIKQKKLYSFHAEDEKKKKNTLVVFSVLKVIELIHEDYPNLDISNEGESDFIVEYVKTPEKPVWMNRLKTVILCILIFFGASFTIMAFNNDVGVTDVFAKFYKQITGMESSGITELEICYSIGLAVGIIVFFNHVGADAASFIHIPVTSVIVDGVASSSTEIESPNELTTSHITKYLYTSVKNVRFENLIGKNVQISIDGVQYNVAFEYNSQLTFVGKYTGLSNNNFSDENILGKFAEGIPLVQASERDSMLISTYSYTIDDSSKKPTIKWSIYHTIDGVLFDSLPNIDGVLGMPKISRDGIYAFVFKNDGPYVYSLLDSGETGKKYTVWHNLLNEINVTAYSALNLDLNVVNDVGDAYNQSCTVNGYFRDDSIFAFTYGDNLAAKQGDPVYGNLYCVYCDGTGNIYKETIFSNTFADYSCKYDNTFISNTKINFDVVSSGSYPNIAVKQTSNNIFTLPIQYYRYTLSPTAPTGKFVEFNLLNIKYENNYSYSPGHLLTPLWGDAVFTAQLYIRQYTSVSKYTVIVNKEIKFVKSNYAPYDNSGAHSWEFEDVYFTYKIQSVADSSSSNGYSQKLTITPKTITLSLSTDGKQLTATNEDGIAIAQYCTTTNMMPQLYAHYDAVDNSAEFAIRFYSSGAAYSNCYGAYYIKCGENVNQTRLLYNYKAPFGDRTTLKDGLIIANSYCISAYVATNDAPKVTKILLTDTSSKPSNNYLAKESNITRATAQFVFADPAAYLVTNNYIYTDYDSNNENSVPLIFSAIPIAFYYSGNKSDNIYLATQNAVYKNDTNTYITVDELHSGSNKYLLPSAYNQLSNYYFSKDNKLYISSPAVSLSIYDTSTIKTAATSFEWYLPEKNTQTFNFNITNLHIISNEQVAIFFEHSVDIVSWDSDITAYRYYTSKIQVGCRKGSSIITTYDGKYTVFASERGLVAMTYQEFVASTDQALTYLTDVMYDVFVEYAQKSPILLFKHAYWIVMYKQNSNQAFIFDLRNNSWWPISTFIAINKIIKSIDDMPEVLSHSMFSLSVSDAKYYDYDGQKYKIPWHIKSQKLYLSALNYYKHIANMTFVSTHDTDELNRLNYLVNALDFKLQINNYRKKIDGNIANEDDYTTVNYNVEIIRTFVQRLNYSKVNEFEYLLSSNEDNAINIPLRLNSITIKYKIGSQVR